jgi:hypothetical protein
MRNSVCKAIRKKLYGDKSRRTKRYSRQLDTGAVVRMDVAGAYRKHKKAWNRLTEAQKRQEMN